MLFSVKQPGPGLGGAGPNAVLCKTCSVLLCVLEQQLGAIDLMPVQETTVHR